MTTTTSAELAPRALKRLKSLSLASTGIGATGADALAAALRRGAMPMLETLNLSANHLGDKGVAALAAPGTLPPLERLGLNSNRLGDASVKALLARTAWAWLVHTMRTIPAPALRAPHLHHAASGGGRRRYI